MKRLSDLTPPGADVRSEIRMGIVLMLFFVFLWSLIFPFRFMSAIAELYYYQNGIKYLWEDAVMQPFGQLMRHAFSGFWLYAAFNMGTAISNYRSFYTESKSIYLMKRLKDGKELHLRCLTLPFFRTVCGVLLVLILMLLYFLLYRFATPEICLPHNIGFDFWGSLL